MEMTSTKLSMSFDPHTIEHLGIKMYSVLPNAIAELIANAYDAEAKNVFIKLKDDSTGKSISVIDDGLGMSFDEINDNFLRIGRKRRDDDNGLSPNGKRKVTGKKGLGKLAFFGIGDVIKISTKKNGIKTIFTLKWKDILKCNTKDYEPEFIKDKCEMSENGTEIELSELKRKTPFDVDGLAISLSKLFNFFDDNFKVFISLNNIGSKLIDNKLKYDNLSPQVEWMIPDTDSVGDTYFMEKKIVGHIFATEKPLKPGMRGVTLFAHGRLINAPEFFGVGESSHGYSYFTGWLNTDFIDELSEDLISTDRQSLNWDDSVTIELRGKLQDLMKTIERDWRAQRKAKKVQGIAKETDIDFTNWYPKLPTTIKTGVEKIVNTIVDNSELDSENQNQVIKTLHELLPEYTYYHYRHLHSAVKESSKQNYENKDYYHAFEETIKRYLREVQLKSGLTDTDVSLMTKAFGKEDKQALKVTTPYKHTDGTCFNKPTIESIEEGQKFLSAGLISGARNPIAHEEVEELRESGLFSENDALDLLSLLSHLFRRLDDAQKTK